MSKSKPRQDVWRNQERHYCAVCNSWMAPDRQSILLHENGKKHKQNVEKALEKKRTDKLREEKDQNALQKTLQRMEQTAMQSLMGQDSDMYAQHLLTSTTASTHNREAQSHSQTPHGAVRAPPHQSSNVSQKAGSRKQEKKQWQAERKRRQEERQTSRQAGKAESDNEESHDQTKSVRRTIGPDEGHYTIDNKTFLEGPTFGGILEEELPVQIWTGPLLASPEEKRLPERDAYWLNGLVAALKTTRKRRLPGDDQEEVLVDVAYLKSDSDTEETLEQSVPLHRIRMVLGAAENQSTDEDDGPPRLPATLEEARVLALGGEEITSTTMESTSSSAQPSKHIDESTGFTSWSTVSIRRTTVSQELKEERQRKREAAQLAKRKQAQKDREAEARRMEEAKVENADDSALGAFDVWSQSAKTGYKGVDISKEVQLSVQDTAKKLVKGGAKVEFKKKKINKKKQSRRVTSADDD